MNFLIWGTGECAKDILNEHKLGYFRNHTILAFVDNVDKGKEKFYGYKIISPDKMNQYAYDQVLVCSIKFEKEIVQQLIGQLDVKEKKIMTINELKENYYNDLVNKLSLLDAKILIVGDEREYNVRSQLYKSFFHICGFVNAKFMDEIKNYKYDYIMLTNLMSLAETDKSEKQIDLERRYIRHISGRLDIDEKKILTLSVLRCFMEQGKRISFGKENPDKVFLVIKEVVSMTGLGAIWIKAINNVLYAKQNGYIPIIDMTSKNQYLNNEEVGKVNAWEKFFEQPGGYSLDDIRRSKNINVSFSLAPALQEDERNEFQFIPKMKPKLKKEVEEYCNEVFTKKKKFLGVLYRGTDYINLRPYGHAIQPSLEMMIAKVKEEIYTGGVRLYFSLYRGRRSS